MVSCPVVVVVWGSESGNVALRVRYEGSCLIDLGNQKIVIVASSCFFYITLPTLMMHSQTQIKFLLNCVTESIQVTEGRFVSRDQPCLT